MEYQKRSGTSGISGQFYETKLLGLVLFRLLRENRIEDFYLATNMDDTGAFDDISLKIKLEGHDRPVAVFLQLKHKDSEDAVLSLDNKTDLIKYINSMSGIKRRITSHNKCDPFFKADNSETDCVFVLYTNARFKLTSSTSKMDDCNSEFVGTHASTLNDLLSTGSAVAAQQFYSEQHVRDFGIILLEEDLKTLAEHFFSFLTDKVNQLTNVMNDEYIQQYHVILRQKVVDVTDIQTQEPDLKWRCLTFQRDFFHSDDKDLVIIRETLFNEVIKKLSKVGNNKEAKNVQRDRITTDMSIDKLISSFLSDPTAATLGPLIGTHIACDEGGKLEFLTDRANDTEKLRQINTSLQTIGEAFLCLQKFKVPITFGNVDLVLCGNAKKTERRFNYLVTSIVGLCQQYKPQESYKVVTIDDTVDSGLLGYNGGLASAVGNLLVYDDETKMMKFSIDLASLPSNSKTLYEKLIEQMQLVDTGVDDIRLYRFDIKTKKIPKLHLDCTDKITEFLGQLVVYEKQRNHREVEELLKHEMQRHLKNEANHSSINVKSVFLHYHNEILCWWMSEKTGRYLTKSTNLYEQAVNDIKEEPQISALYATFHINNSVYFRYSFNENATKWMEMVELPSSTFIITDTVTLTTVKVIQCLKNHYSINKYVLLDSQCVFKLPAAEFRLLNAEIRKTSKVLIILFHEVHNNSEVDSMLSKLTQATEGKKIIVITNLVFVNKLNKYFFNSNKVFKDETQNLTAMTAESQEELLKHAQVTLQGQEVALNMILDDVSILFIKGIILDKIIRNNIIHFGTSLRNTSYEEIKPLYMDRRVSPLDASNHDTYDDAYLVKTFHDIEDDVVLVTAAPGMGKSTLLTHLSLNTREYDIDCFIVRVNFLDHSKQFYEWHKNKVIIGATDALKFLCQVALRNHEISFNLKISNKQAHVVNCVGEGEITFNLNMFLHFYNRRKLIFVFDGFDEICPHYKQVVVNFLDVAKNVVKKNKMWITSRPYTDVLPELQRLFGRCYKLERLSLIEQELYLERFWREKGVYQKLSDKQHEKFKSFVYVRTYLCQIGNDLLDENELNRLLQLKEQLRLARVDNMSGIPLILYFIADYFLHRVILDNDPSKMDLHFNLHSMYEMFIENKLKKILFQDKNKMDMYNPDIIMRFERERDDCIATHKILAAYALLRDPVFRELELKELDDMNPLNQVGEVEFYSLLTNIKEGADKIGLVSYVIDDVPVFIHRTFAEYFAAGYICDILKSDKFNLHQKTLFYFSILTCHYNFISRWIDIKVNKDEDLRQIVKYIEARELKPLLDLSNVRWYFISRILSKTQFIRLISSSADDYAKGCLDKYVQQFNVLDAMKDDFTPFTENLYRDISSKMKPHLKEHFNTNSRYEILSERRDYGKRKKKCVIL